MAIINLRDYYPFYTSDYFMEVPEDVVEMFKEFDRKEGKRSIASTCSSTPFSAIIVSHYTESKKLSTQLF